MVGGGNKDEYFMTHENHMIPGSPLVKSYWNTAVLPGLCAAQAVPAQQQRSAAVQGLSSSRSLRYVLMALDKKKLAIPCPVSYPTQDLGSVHRLSFKVV